MALKLQASSSQYLSRTTSLPSTTAVTFMGVARIDADRSGTQSLQNILMIGPAGGPTIQLLWSDSYGTGLGSMDIASFDGSGFNYGGFASRPAVGEWFVFYIRCDGIGAGRLQAGWRRPGDASWVTASTTLTDAGAPTRMYLGGYIDFETDYSDISFDGLKVWDAFLTDAEIENEWLIRRPAKGASLNQWTPMVHDTLANAVIDYGGAGRDWTGVNTPTVVDGAPIGWGGTAKVAPYAAASGSSSIAPGAGSLAYTGYAPTLATISSVAPGAGSLSYTGYAPAIGSATTISPGKGALAYTGYAPSLITPSAVAPAKGSLSYTGYAPSLIKPSEIAPGKGSLSYTGYAPALSGASSISPGAGSLAYTGYQPAVGSTTTISPAKGSLAYTGYAPKIGTTIGPGHGALHYTGYAPTLQGVPLAVDLIPVVNNLEQLRKQANRILSQMAVFLPKYGPTLPDVDPDYDGRLFVKTTDQTLYQQQYGAWVAVDMVP